MKLPCAYRLPGDLLHFLATRNPEQARRALAVEHGEAHLCFVAIPPAALGAERLVRWIEARFALQYAGADRYRVSLASVRWAILLHFGVLPAVRRFAGAPRRHLFRLRRTVATKAAA